MDRLSTVRRSLRVAGVLGLAGLGLGLGLGGGDALAVAPDFTVTSVVKSGQTVPGVGNISMIVGNIPAERGIYQAAVNNSGQWVVTIDTPNNTFPETDEALLRSATGLTPYIHEGNEGYLFAPTSSVVATDFLGISLADSGVAALNLGTIPDEFTPESPSTALYSNNNKVLAQEGMAVTAAGVAGGTTWGPFNAATWIDTAGNNRFMVNSTIIESGVPRRAIIVIQTDGSGNVTSQTLIAKENPGGGASAWATLGSGPHSAAVNNAGVVAFSGVTNGGTNGVYSTAGAGAFVATQGGSSPLAGKAWGSLLSVPLDINNSNKVAFRAKTAPGSGVYTEPSPDGGETINDSIRTTGNGTLTALVGTLTNDHDIDLYRLVVTDQSAFSASTVGGASFDTQLILIAEPGDGGRGVRRSNDASAGVAQSTITGGVVTGREYLLAVCTPKVTAAATQPEYATATNATLEIWQPDPATVVYDDGVLYWPDPSAGVIRRVTTAGAPLSDIAAPLVTTSIAVDGVNDKIYWIDRTPRIRRANLDGSGVQDINTTVGFGTLTADEGTGLAVDPVNNKIYWSRRRYGEITRSDLDGANPQRVFKIYFYDGIPAASANFAPTSVAIDPGTNKVYWYNRFLDRIERADVNASTGAGSNRQTLAVGAGARTIALDLAAGKIYWTVPAQNAIRRADLDGTGEETVLAVDAPAGLSLNAAGGTAYWTNTAARVIRSSPLAALSVTNVASAPADTGSVAADGEGASSSFSDWQRSGTPSGSSLAYQVAITGATFEYEEAVIMRGAQKVVASGDPVSGTAGLHLAQISGSTQPLRIADNDAVLWHGVWHGPSASINAAFEAMFLNTDRILSGGDTPAGTDVNGQKVIFFWTTPRSFDLSADGRYALIVTNMQDPPFNFTNQRDNALLLEFDINVCKADFNGVNGVTVQDIFDFLTAWLAGSPSADFNGVNGVTVQDIFDFLTAWLAGC